MHVTRKAKTVSAKKPQKRIVTNANSLATPLYLMMSKVKNFRNVFLIVIQKNILRNFADQKPIKRQSFRFDIPNVKKKKQKAYATI